jgi:hypothetical protein
VATVKAYAFAVAAINKSKSEGPNPFRKAYAFNSAKPTAMAISTSKQTNRPSKIVAKSRQSLADCFILIPNHNSASQITEWQRLHLHVSANAVPRWVMAVALMNASKQRCV